MHSDQIVEATAQALAMASSGRPGPVHLALPADVTGGETADPDPAGVKTQNSEPPDIAQLVLALEAAERPLLILGPALNPTRAPELRDLAKRTDIPVAAMESPRGLRDPALGKLRQITDEADLIIALGKQIDFSLGFGAGTKANWYAVLPDAADLVQAQKNLGGRLVDGLIQDPRATALALADHINSAKPPSQWRARAEDLIAYRAEPADAGDAITPWQVTQALQRHIDAATDPILICDGGEFGQWAQAGLAAPRRVINGLGGAIGGGLPYAIATGVACPGAQVFACMGDGTTGFHLTEFETAVRYGLPLVAIVGNDRCWNAEHQLQLREFGADRLTGCDLTGARYDLAAAALGGHGEFVTRADDLDAAIARAVASGLPSLVNVEIQGLAAP
jgi:acetolactate synthase-1/2/3 large subunit